MKIINWSAELLEQKGLYSFVNLYSYLLLRRKPKFDKISFMSDGFLICLLAKILRYNLQRYSFDMTSIAPTVFKHFSKKNVAVIGSTEENVNIFSRYLRDEFQLEPSLICSGYFGAIKMRDICSDIVATEIDLVVVGLGTPFQEEFLLCLNELGFNGVAFTCGGFITQTALSKGVYYPSWINRLNLRFVYRMYKEPHTIRRYLMLYPKGALLFMLDAVFKRNNISR